MWKISWLAEEMLVLRKDFALWSQLVTSSNMLVLWESGLTRTEERELIFLKMSLTTFSCQRTTPVTQLAAVE